MTIPELVAIVDRRVKEHSEASVYSVVKQVAADYHEDFEELREAYVAHLTNQGAG